MGYSGMLVSAVACLALLSSVQATAPTVGSTFPPKTSSAYNYSEALHKIWLFYWAQRSGPLPYNRLAWRTDSCSGCTGAGGENLKGGYLEAGGSYMKIGLPNCFTLTTIAWGINEFRDGYTKVNELNEALAALRWGTDYLIASHPSANKFVGIFGNSVADFQYYGPPEFYEMYAPQNGTRKTGYVTPTNPASDIAGECAAALAASSIAFRDTDANYSSTLLVHARQLYDLANVYRGTFMTSTDPVLQVHAQLYANSHYMDELVWGALWMFLATLEKPYLADAEKGYDDALTGASPQGFELFGWESKGPGISILLNHLGAYTSKPAKYATDVTSFFNGYISATPKIPYTNNGLVFPYGGWGPLRYAGNIAFLALSHSNFLQTIPGGDVLFAAKLHNYALTQVGFILGDSGRSYMVGFGKNSPTSPFHKSSWNSWNNYPTRGQDIDTQRKDFQENNPTVPNRWKVYGAVVGGPSDQTGATYSDSRYNYTQAEPALDYPAGLTGALAGLINFYTNQAPTSDCGLDLGWTSLFADQSKAPSYPKGDCYHTCCANSTATASVSSQSVASAPAASPSGGRKLIENWAPIAKSAGTWLDNALNFW